MYSTLGKLEVEFRSFVQKYYQPIKKKKKEKNSLAYTGFKTAEKYCSVDLKVGQGLPESLTKYLNLNLLFI